MTQFAVITGASRGIGRALTLELTSRGLTVIAISQNETALQSLKALNPEKIKVISADITTVIGREKILNTLRDVKINFLINNAGIINPIGALHKASEIEIRKLFETNFLAPIFLTNAFIPHFHESDGRILNVTSVAADEAVPGILAYCTSKSALNMWTAGLKKELPSNIVAADVIPGEVATDMQGDLRSAPVDSFPLATEFKEAEKHGTLIRVAVCAEFLSDVLLKTTPEKFSSKKWNIYHDYNKPIPQPFNKKKLASDS